MGRLNGEAIFQQDDLHVFSQLRQVPVVRDKRRCAVDKRGGDVQRICRSQAILSTQPRSLPGNVPVYVNERQIGKMSQDFFVILRHVAALQLPGAHRHLHQRQNRGNGCQMSGFDAAKQGLRERKIRGMTFDVIDQNAGIQPNVRMAGQLFGKSSQASRSC